MTGLKPDFRMHNNLDALVWADTSAEQHALYLQAFELARVRVREALAEDALGEDAERFCLFSDLDETLLDNSQYNAWLVRHGRNFNERGSWARYCRARISKLTAGAAAFMQEIGAMRDQGGNPIEIFYVTSRLEELREPTAQNLVALGLPLPDASADITKTHLFMAGLGVPGGGARKYDHYAYIATARRRKPILWLGDNLSDFSPNYSSSVPAATRLVHAESDRGSWGKRWIAFPNPVYGGFLLSLPKITKPDGTLMTMGDDLRSGEPTDERVREPVTPESTPKTSVLDVWDQDPDAKP
jgi:5'-nucleotidase (lipoprotein e(P4) family)